MFNLQSPPQERSLRKLKDRRTILLIESPALAMVAAEVASAWGVYVTDGTFYRRDVRAVIAGFDSLSEHDRVMLEWAILDNVFAYCAWITPDRRSLRTATLWPQYRPSYLNPLNYRDWRFRGCTATSN
jgi:hypothetical protein